MAFASATIKMCSGESIDCTGISYSAGTGRWSITGSNDLTSRATWGLIATSATAGTILADDVISISFS